MGGMAAIAETDRIETPALSMDKDFDDSQKAKTKSTKVILLPMVRSEHAHGETVFLLYLKKFSPSSPPTD